MTELRKKSSTKILFQRRTTYYTNLHLIKPPTDRQFVPHRSHQLNQ